MTNQTTTAPASSRKTGAMTTASDPWANSEVTAFYPSRPKRVHRGGGTVEWVVVVRTGSIVDHHRFAEELDAVAFALQVDPHFRLDRMEEGNGD